MSRVGILDIGTNTFHLVVFEITPERSFHQIYKEKKFVKLASEGIDKIGEAPYERAMAALKYFREKIKDLEVDDLLAFGTEAMRNASNANQLVEDARNITGINIEVISGAREAALISKGVQMAAPFGEEPLLIMDIGGGSIELIIADKETIYFSQSHPVGGVTLRKNFHQNEPITEKEISSIENHLKDTFDDFIRIIDRYAIKKLAGASGSFDTLGEILFYPQTQDDLFKTTNAVEISIGQFKEVYEQLRNTTMEQRLNFPGLISDRADLIVVAAVAINFVIQQVKPETILLSNFAMKEGVLLEYLEKE